ncbi:MAG: RecX family transcriptional regulator [Paenacidovorax caeni]
MAFATLSSRAARCGCYRSASTPAPSWQAKLARHVQEGDDLEAVLDDLEANDFINAERVAESVVHRRAGGDWGPNGWCRSCARALNDGLVRNTADRLRATELERARAVWQQRWRAPATDPKERAPDAFFGGTGFCG